MRRRRGSNCTRLALLLACGMFAAPIAVPAAHPDLPPAFSLDFPRASIVLRPGLWPARVGLDLRIEPDSFPLGESWDVTASGTGVYLLRYLGGEGFQWLLDLPKREVRGVFGGAAALGERREVVLPELRLEQPPAAPHGGPVFQFLLPEVSFRFEQGGRVGGAWFAQVPLTRPKADEWLWEEGNDGVSRLSHRSWASGAWEVDFDNLEVRQWIPLGANREPQLKKIASVLISRPRSATEEAAGVQPDVAMSRLGRPAPASAWLEKEKALHRGILATGQYDLLVVPFQVQGSAVDPAGRDLMTRYLTRHLGAAGASLPSTTLLVRALGERARTYDEAEVYRLADDLKVKLLVRGYVGHDRLGRMRLTVIVQEREGDRSFGSAGRLRTATWLHIPFHDEMPPSEAMRGLLEDMMDRLQLPQSVLPPPHAYPKAEGLGVPSSLAEILEQYGGKDPVRRAYGLQFLGILCPEDEPARESLFARSLVALEELSPDSPDYSLLRARALFWLHQRPAAVAALPAPVTPEARAFWAFLEGNLPELLLQASAIAEPLPRLMAEIEATDLGYAYGGQLYEPRAPGTIPLDEVESLAKRRQDEGHSWPTQHNGEVARLMVKAFGEKGLAARVDDPGDPDTAVARYRKRMLTDRSSAAWWAGDEAGPVQGDLLDLLANAAAANLRKAVWASIVLRGLPSEGLAALDRWEPLLQGHPLFVRLRAQGLELLWQKDTIGPPDEAATKLRSEFLETCLDALVWSGGQNQTSLYCRNLLQNTGHPEERPTRATLYEDDYPTRADWLPSYPPDRLLLQKHALTGRNATSVNADLVAVFPYQEQRLLYDNGLARSSLRHYLDEIGRTRGPAAAERFEAVNRDRFHGSPWRRPLAPFQEGEDYEAATRRFEETIAAAPDMWLPYRHLGNLRMSSGDFQGAALTYLRYPLFREPSRGNRVAISNFAFESALDLWWRGALEEAAPLLRLSVNSETGSGASMASGALLDLTAGDYAGAVEHFLALAERYDHAEGFGYAAELLHVMGRKEEAWDLFGRAVGRKSQPRLSRIALVLPRGEGWSLGDVVAWLSREEFQADASQLFAPLVVDRPSDPAVEEAIAALESRQSLPPLPGAALGQLQATGRISRLAEGYRLLRVGSPEDANSLLSREFPADMTGRWGPATVYLARSAVLSGRMASFETALSARAAKKPPDPEPYLLEIAHAFLRAGKGSHEEAVARLRSARAQLPVTGHRSISPWYQLVEACEWLYEDTGRNEYRDLAVAWAKTHQRVQPHIAWAYAVEARYADGVEARLPALAMTLLLDSQSSRIASLAEEEKLRALARLEGRNPFLSGPARHPCRGTPTASPLQTTDDR